MADFPAAEFRMDGEPGSIRASGDRWTAFGAAATEAATQIRSLDSSLFVGPEGDQYRAGLDHDLPPHLDTTGRAYTAVGTCLTTYANALTGLQARMTPLRTRAPALWRTCNRPAAASPRPRRQTTSTLWTLRAAPRPTTLIRPRPAPTTPISAPPRPA